MLEANPVAGLVCVLQRTDPCVRWAETAARHAARMPPGEMQANSVAAVRPVQMRALIFSGKSEQAETQAQQWLRLPDWSATLPI